MQNKKKLCAIAASAVAGAVVGTVIKKVVKKSTNSREDAIAELAIDVVGKAGADENADVSIEIGEDSVEVYVTANMSLEMAEGMLKLEPKFSETLRSIMEGYRTAMAEKAEEFRDYGIETVVINYVGFDSEIEDIEDKPLLFQVINGECEQMLGETL